MSQGFRKNPKPAEFTDTTGVSPLQRGDDQRNARRTQQITHLHQQFEDLKRKIREVQNKNEKIIEKIHKAYNFKKKNTYTEEFLAETNPVIHYDNGMEVYSGANMSVQSKSDKNSQQDFRLQKRISDIPPSRKNKKPNNLKINYSVQYGKNDQFIEDSESGSIQNYPHQANYYPTSTQMPPKAPSYYPGRSSAKINTKQVQRSITPSQDSRKSPYRYSQLEKNQEEQEMVDKVFYEDQIRALQQELQQKQTKLYRLSAVEQKYKTERKNFQTIVQDRMEEFFDRVVMSKMQEIDKVHKKFQYKIKNLKRAAFQAKDRKEDKISKKLIEEGRKNRNNSRSRSRSRLPSPNRNRSSRNLAIDRDLDTSRRSNNSNSCSRLEMKEDKNKEFQEIAQKYEELIRTKNQQIQKIQNKYKNKERQCYQMKMRIDLLQKKLSQYEERIATEGDDLNQLGSFGELPNPMKKASIQTNLLQNLLESEGVDYSEKLRRLESELSDKDNKISDLIEKLKKNQDKMRNIHKQYQESQQKLKTKHKQQLQEIKNLNRLVEEEKNSKIEQIKELKTEISLKEKQIMQKDCDSFTKDNKLKKIELVLEGKEKKIEELQKLITSNNQNTPVNTSRDMESSRKDEDDQNYQQIAKQLKEELYLIEQQLQANKNEVFALSKTKDFYVKKNQELEVEKNVLKKQKQLLQIENQQLKANVNINNISAVNSECHSQNEESLARSKIEDEQENSKYSEHKIRQLTQQKQQWFQKYQEQKNKLLEKESNIIKMKTQINYCKKNSQVLEDKMEKMRKQLESLRNENKKLSSDLQEKEHELEIERQQNQQKITEIEKQWAEFEEEVRKNQDEDILASDYKSERSMSMFSYAQSKIGSNAKVQHLQTQIELLTVRLKESEAELQTQKIMEDKVMNEYRMSVEQSKKQLKQRTNELNACKEQNGDLYSKIDQLGLQVRTLQEQLEFASSKETTVNNANNSRKYTQLIDKIEELEHELKQTRQINSSLTEMETQLFEQVKIKEEERVELYEEIKNKELKIKELGEQISMLREDTKREDNTIGNRNPYNSHISSSSNRRQSIKSQSSLKYSAYSHNNDKMLLGSSHKFSQDQKLDFELSQAGSEFYDIDQGPAQYQYNEQPSHLSNISDIFMREDPFEKMKKVRIKRADQLKLFEKTASYIKSLKTVISDKDKRIKLLQKKIQSLKSSELVRKQLGYCPDDPNLQILISAKQENEDMDGDTFKDYQSVQLDNRRSGNVSLRRYRQIQHDMGLVREENIMFTYKIQALQEDLIKAEEQQNSLVKIKDLYKEEIKKLIKKNEETTQKFEEEIRKQKKRVEESESVHNLQAIKQLFIKIIQTIASKFTEDTGSFSNARKKEEKRKQIEQYVKVMSNILRLEKKTKQGLLALLQQSR